VAGVEDGDDKPARVKDAGELEHGADMALYSAMERQSIIQLGTLERIKNFRGMEKQKSFQGIMSLEQRSRDSPCRHVVLVGGASVMSSLSTRRHALAASSPSTRRRASRQPNSSFLVLRVNDGDPWWRRWPGLSSPTRALGSGGRVELPRACAPRLTERTGGGTLERFGGGTRGI
jgi:hypothetical protein